MHRSEQTHVFGLEQVIAGCVNCGRVWCPESRPASVWTLMCQKRCGDFCRYSRAREHVAQSGLLNKGSVMLYVRNSLFKVRHLCPLLHDSICMAYDIIYCEYLNLLRVIYPSIEAIINAMLIEAGEVPERFRGLVEKAQKLEQQGIVPYFWRVFLFCNVNFSSLLTPP